jgi:hypothetical protein
MFAFDLLSRGRADSVVGGGEVPSIHVDRIRVALNDPIPKGVSNTCNCLKTASTLLPRTYARTTPRFETFPVAGVGKQRYRL